MFCQETSFPENTRKTAYKGPGFKFGGPRLKILDRKRAVPKKQRAGPGRD